MSPPSPRSTRGRSASVVQDFDLHGVVGVRVVGAGADDLAVVRRQLGPIEGSLERDPDITIRFVDELRPGPLTLIGAGESGFDDDTFVLMRGRGGVDGLTSVPFDRVGRGLEIVCERRLPAVPHLVALVNLTALAKGVLPVHAAAFTTGSTGVLVTGWSKGGKTETLLGSLGREVEYVGDEWVYLTDDGRMLGLPEPIRIWGWQLDQLPTVLGARPARDRRRLASWRRLAGLVGSGARRSIPGAGILRRAEPVLGRQAYLQIPPAELFGADRIALEGRLDAVVLLMSHQEPSTVARPVEPAEIAARMHASLEEERVPLMSAYRQFRYAFPDRESSVVETAAEQEAKLLTALLADRPSVKVVHPYPCDLQQLSATVIDAVDKAVHDASTAPSPDGPAVS